MADVVGRALATPFCSVGRRGVASARGGAGQGGARRGVRAGSARSRRAAPSPAAAEEKSTGSILDDIGSMFDDLADQLDAMLE